MERKNLSLLPLFFIFSLSALLLLVLVKDKQSGVNPVSYSVVIKSPAVSRPQALGTTTVTLSPTDDSYISQDYPDSAAGGSYGWLYIERVVGLSNPKRTLLKFDLSSIPSGSTISSSKLTLYTSNCFHTGGDNDKIVVAKSKADWSQATVTWNNQPSHEDLFTQTTPCVQGTSFDITLTDLTTSWISGSVPNYGVFLHVLESTADAERILKSKENTTVENRPKLTVTYTPPAPPPSPPPSSPPPSSNNNSPNQNNQTTGNTSSMPTTNTSNQGTTPTVKAPSATASTAKTDEKKFITLTAEQALVGGGFLVLVILLAGAGLYILKLRRSIPHKVEEEKK